MAQLKDIIVDARHPASLARFWAAVLEGYAVAPYDDAEIERLRAIGIDDIDDDPTVLVEPPPGSSGPRLWFQQVPETKVTKNRVHLDLATDDFDAELARVIALGARLADTQGNDHWVVLLDPEGNEFCLMR